MTARGGVDRPRAPDRRAVRPIRSLRAIVVVLVLGAGLFAATTAAPPPVASVGPLPECRLDDILTVPRDYDSWSTTLVDWLLSVGKDYKPPDLVSVRTAGLTGSGYIRKVAIDDLRAMAKAAANNGTPIGSWSAYRSYAQQVELFNGYVKAYGRDNAIEFSHRPGHSEHQLGLAIDFMASGANGMLSGTSATGKWMAKNSWKYGWVLSYPPSKTDPSHLWNETVCFRYEPWHYRYLGREIAAKVHKSGLTIREYLWANFTMVDPATGKPIPSATPSLPSQSPAASPTATLSALAGGSPAAPTESTRPNSATGPAFGGWFGVDPLVVVGMLILLGLVGFVVARLYVRRTAAERRARSRVVAQARRRGG